MGSSCQFVFHSFSVGKLDSLVMFCSCCDMLLILPTIMQSLGCYGIICLNNFLLRHNVSTSEQLLWTTIIDEGVMNCNNRFSIITIELEYVDLRCSVIKFHWDWKYAHAKLKLNDNEEKYRYVGTILNYSKTQIFLDKHIVVENQLDIDILQV